MSDPDCSASFVFGMPRPPTSQIWKTQHQTLKVPSVGVSTKSKILKWVMVVSVVQLLDHV